MLPVLVLPKVIPRRPTGVIIGSTSDEHASWSPTLVPLHARGIERIQSECEFDPDAAMRPLAAWWSPLVEQRLRVLPGGAYAYSTVVSEWPASTISLVKDLVTVTNTLGRHAAPLVAGADLSPSFSTHLSNVTATTPITLEIRRQYLRSRFSAALADARSEEFDFGAESRFAQRIAELVLQYGGEALGTFEATITESRMPLTVLGELFRTLGRIRSAITHEDRRAVLLRFLAAPGIRVRHVAATGLAELDDPAAIPALQTALTAERSERLRSHLRLVLDQLQATNVALRHR